MNNSVVLYHGRDDNLYVVDPDCIPHFDEHPPIIEIVIAVINAGYAGVFVDEKKLSNGRFILGLSVNQGTPEGQVIQNLVSAVDAGKQLPSIGFVLDQIKNQYAVSGGHHE